MRERSICFSADIKKGGIKNTKNDLRSSLLRVLSRSLIKVNFNKERGTRHMSAVPIAFEHLSHSTFFEPQAPLAAGVYVTPPEPSVHSVPI